MDKLKKNAGNTTSGMNSYKLVLYSMKFAHATKIIATDKIITYDLEINELYPVKSLPIK